MPHHVLIGVGSALGRDAQGCMARPRQKNTDLVWFCDIKINGRYISIKFVFQSNRTLLRPIRKFRKTTNGIALGDRPCTLYTVSTNVGKARSSTATSFRVRFVFTSVETPREVVGGLQKKIFSACTAHHRPMHRRPPLHTYSPGIGALTMHPLQPFRPFSNFKGEQGSSLLRICVFTVRTEYGIRFDKYGECHAC